MSGQDRYDRLVAKVYLGEIDVNAWLVTQGYAWAYRDYLTDKSMVALEDEARRAKRGQWSQPERTPPWEWRRAAKRRPKDDFDDFEMPSENADKSTFECGTKRYCGDMATCDEAKFFMTRCNLPKLDGDHDGVPCEALCR